MAMSQQKKRGLWTTLIFTAVVLFVGVKFNAKIVELWNTYVGKYFNGASTNV